MPGQAEETPVVRQDTQNGLQAPDGSLDSVLGTLRHTTLILAVGQASCHFGFFVLKGKKSWMGR